MTEYNYTNAPIGHREVTEDSNRETSKVITFLRCSCGLLVADRDQLAEHHAAVRKRELAAVGAPADDMHPMSKRILSAVDVDEVNKIIDDELDMMPSESTLYRVLFGLAIKRRAELATEAGTQTRWNPERSANERRCGAWSYPNHPSWEPKLEHPSGCKPEDGRQCALFVQHYGNHALTGPFNDSRAKGPPGMRQEFYVHPLNDSGVAKTATLTALFSETLSAIEAIVPAGRERSLVVTKLQEAAHFAARAVTLDPANHK